uniref:Uncharacterized protein n=1 Tax=Setaria viridis TaxID=4556 RepID=A0A4U6UHR9_SETVI|nr:hypothetical protein SEVIR_5G174000v2 [Setaria viridis]
MKRESVPSWLELLHATQFFTTCTSHLLASRNECMKLRSSYHNVVRISEIEDIIDISDVQTYIINSARVVFLNERPQQRGCDVFICRALLDVFHFCSLGCNDMDMTAMVENSLQCSGKDDVTRSEDVGSSTDSDKDSSNDKNEEEPQPKRIARHRRKGIPQRAPFF